MQSSRSRSSPAGQRRLKSSAVWHFFDFTSLQTAALRYYLNKYNVLSQPFVDSKGDEIDLLKSGHLVRIIPIKEVKFMLDNFFCLTLDDGSKCTVKFFEWKLLALFYENESIYINISKELCIALDVALGSSGWEAFVEGFYILVNVHEKPSGQSNDILVQRALVDWTLPHSISCQKTVILRLA